MSGFQFHETMSGTWKRGDDERAFRFTIDAHVASALAFVSDHAVKFAPIVLIVASLLALGGLYTDRLVPVQTDIKKLIPADAPGLVAMTKVADATGSSTDVAFLVRADDVTSAKVFVWMVGFENKELAGHSQIVSITSLPSVLGVKTIDPAKMSPASLTTAAAQIPTPILNSLVSPDHKAASMTSMPGTIVDADGHEVGTAHLDFDLRDLPGFLASFRPQL